MVKVAIIGFGYMGHFHLKRTRQVPGIMAVGIHDILPEKHLEADEEGIPFYEDLDRLLALPELDLVIICTPNEAHAPIARKALQAGKHVLCEKPAVLDPDELRQVQAEAEASEKIFTVHHNRRWDDDYLSVKQVVESGSIGDIVTVESRVLGERGVVYGWRADPVHGGGMLYDWGPHLFDQLLKLFPDNKVTEVSARLKSVLTPAVDDFTQVNIVFDNDVHALVQIGTMALQKLPRWYVYGSRGTMKLEGFSTENGGLARIRGEVQGFESVVHQEALGPSRTMAPLEKEHLETLALPRPQGNALCFYENLVNAILSGAAPLVSPADIYRETMLIDAVFHAARQKKTLKVTI